jgi:hypothetical protein
VSSKRFAWILVAAVATMVVTVPASWACDKTPAQAAEAKDAAKPSGAKAEVAEVAKTGAVAPTAVPAVNGAVASPCAGHAPAANSAANGAVPAAAPAVNAAGQAPCPMAGAAQAKGQAPCAGKDGKPCCAKGAATVAQAEKPADAPQAEKR